VLATPSDDAAATLALLAEAVGAADMELPSESVAQFAPPGTLQALQSTCFCFFINQTAVTVQLQQGYASLTILRAPEP
jgi:hypothetical protein